ncbi:unnamed protein product [Sphagnum compactum]
MGIPLHSCSLHSSAAATLVASSSDLSQSSKWLRSYKPPISSSRRSSNSRCEAAAARCLASTGYGREQEQQDAAYMRECVELARQAIGHTSPNPMVGCVLVKEGKVVGRGFHPKAGQPHAEVFALREAGELAENATAYVSLEPCNHFGRTPPCSAALVRSRVKRVVVGMIDPNPKVAGSGVKTLQDAGIEVVVGVEEELCRNMNEVFIHHMCTNKPFVILRYSMSMDGGLLGSLGFNAAVPGSSYSRLLQEVDAVVVTDAAVYNDPVLLSSEPNAKQPLRVILARFLFSLLAAPTMVLADQSAWVMNYQSTSMQDGKAMEHRLQARGVDVVMLEDLSLEQVLSVCYLQGAYSVLLDSRGPDLSGLENFLGQHAVREDVVNKLVVNISPVLLGENRTGPGFCLGDDLLKLERVSTRVSGRDVVIEGYFPN